MSETGKSGATSERLNFSTKKGNKKYLSFTIRDGDPNYKRIIRALINIGDSPYFNADSFAVAMRHIMYDAIKYLEESDVETAIQNHEFIVEYIESANSAYIVQKESIQVQFHYYPEVYDFRDAFKRLVSKNPGKFANYDRSTTIQYGLSGWYSQQRGPDGDIIIPPPP